MYPIVLNLNELPVLVIGGGRVAARKIAGLLSAGARVTVISPSLSEDLMPHVRTDAIEWTERHFAPGDTTGFRLVFTATDDREQNRIIAEEARRAGILVNVADSPDESSFHVPSTIRRGELLLTVSTGGGSPLLAARIRRELEERYGEEYARLLELLAEAREEARRRIPNQLARQTLYEAILDSDALARLRDGDLTGAKRLIADLMMYQPTTRERNP